MVFCVQLVSFVKVVGFARGCEEMLKKLAEKTAKCQLRYLSGGNCVGFKNAGSRCCSVR